MSLTRLRHLPAGPHLLGHQTRAFRTAALALFIRAGSCHERAPLLGVSHLLEHLAFRGSSRYSAREIVLFVEGQGGSINAFTTEEYTCFHLQVFPEEVERALDILIDMAARPLLRAADVEKEREIALDEAKSCGDQPISFLADLFAKSLWGSHPLGNCVGGTVRCLKSMRREQIAAFHAEHYRASKALIAFAGDLDFEEIAEHIQRRSNRWPASSQQQKPSVKPRFGAPGKVRFASKGLDQVHFQLGVRLWPRDDQQRIALNLLNVIAGENMASRLFQEIREKRGLAYHIASECTHFSAASSFGIQCIAGEEKLPKCLTAISESLRQLQSSLTEGELERARCYLRGQTFQELDSPMGAALWFGEQFLSGFSERPHTEKELVKHLGNIDVAQMRELAGALIGDIAWRIAFVGPGRAKIAAFDSWRQFLK